MTFSKNIKFPRTPRDFRFFESMRHAGFSYEKQMEIFSKADRSGIYTLAGVPHCVSCLRVIVLAECLECGMTHDGGHSHV